MKAPTWQRRVAAAAGLVIAGLCAAPLAAQSLVVPAGLPALPGLGETMQRNLRSGLALDGYDPVAYQALGRPVPGRVEFELVQNGVVWRFASAANREAFRETPSAYEPVYSGFDPVGVTEGRVVESDPMQFAVLGGRLHLFRTAANRVRFLADPALQHDAAANWPALLPLIGQ